MFRNIDKAIAYIESKRHKNTIESFGRILEELGINTKQKNMIHIAGTNGKGSTVNYLRSILNAHGYHVGSFTSPYMIKHNDRIRIDDHPISDEDLLALINKYESVIEEKNQSMFEIDVLIMLDYFSTHDLDYRIIECGMDLTLQDKDVLIVNHYNRNAARSYIDLCNKLSKAFHDKYTDKQYIKDKWFTDKFIINDVNATNNDIGIVQYITKIESDRYSVSAIMWLSDIKDYIDSLLKYVDFDFVAKAFKIYNITDTRFELIRKLYHYFYD